MEDKLLLRASKKRKWDIRSKLTQNFPVKVKDITKSEKQKSNIPNINVLSMNKIKSKH